jgi:hypothetical protein
MLAVLLDACEQRFGADGAEIATFIEDTLRVSFGTGPRPSRRASASAKAVALKHPSLSAWKVYTLKAAGHVSPCSPPRRTADACRRLAAAPQDRPDGGNCQC